MSYKSLLVVIEVLIICFVSEMYGEFKRRSGRAVTTRDILLVKLAAQVVGWLLIGRLLLVDYARITLGSILLVSVCSLFLLALTLGSFWLMGLNARDGSKSRKPTSPDPLD